MSQFPKHFNWVIIIPTSYHAMLAMATLKTHHVPGPLHPYPANSKPHTAKHAVLWFVFHTEGYQLSLWGVGRSLHLRSIWPQIQSSFPYAYGHDVSQFPWKVLINTYCLGVIINSSSLTFKNVLVWTINCMVVLLALYFSSEKETLPFYKRHIYLENSVWSDIGGQAICPGLVNNLGVLVY